VLGWETGNPVLSLMNSGGTGGFLNHGLYSSEAVDAKLALIAAETDYDKQMALVKEVSVMILYDVPQIPLYMSPSGHNWWPWVKNHYGEFSLADGSFNELVPYMWIDQDLKAEMGY